MTLKDSLFNMDTVSGLADRIVSVNSVFDKESFIKDCLQAFPSLELKDRMIHVSNMIDRYLTGSFIENADMLLEALQGEEEAQFIYGSVIEYIKLGGLNDEYVDQALDYLGEFTQYLSSEFAIRSFLNLYPDKTLKKMMIWATSDNVHKRRLASEGTRPKLPWAEKISISYKDTYDILNTLFDDKDRYVTRSVANHLNDISKIDPDYVIELLQEWKQSNKQEDKEMKYMINHSLRTLIKKGHKGTLEFLGFHRDAKLNMIDSELSKSTYSVGDTLEWNITFESLESSKFIVDYCVHYVTKHNKTTSKIYKHRVIEVEQNQSYSLLIKRPLKQRSTRTLYPGKHEIELLVNGVSKIKKAFLLER